MSGKQNGAANGTAKTNGRGTTVKRAVFEKNPAPYVEKAIAGSAVTITDAKGNPRAMIVVPRPPREFIADE